MFSTHRPKNGNNDTPSTALPVMSYIIATTHTKIRWYKFEVGHIRTDKTFELLDILDLSQVPQFGDKRSAKLAAQALGLSVWRYVKI